MTNKEKTERLEEIKTDLLDQLERNGTIGKYYTDLVNDYMSLCGAALDLIEDIKTRGSKVYIETAQTSNLKTNDSVPDLLKVNAQKLKIIDLLGLKPVQGGGGAGGDVL